MKSSNKFKFQFSPIVRSMKVLDEESYFPIHRVFCIGKNYSEHAKEMGSEVEKK